MFDFNRGMASSLDISNSKLHISTEGPRANRIYSSQRMESNSVLVEKMLSNSDDFDLAPNQFLSGGE